MTDETTTEQLVEIEGQTEDTPVTEYTPPEGWRVLAVGERLREGDVWVNHEGESRPTKRVGERVNDERYIRPIEPQPELVQVREGRWRTRGGDIRNVTPTPTHDSRRKRWPWRDAAYDQTWTPDGQNQFNCEESPSDLVEYLGPIEPKAEPVPAVQGGLVRDVTHLLEESGVLDQAKAEQRIEELRSEVSYVQRLLGESRQRVTQLEELVASLRTINEGQEKAFEAAGQDNTALRNQLAAVKAELSQVSRDRYLLQIELDAREQVPEAVSDRFDQGFEQGTARAVETIAEWLEPLRKGNTTLRAAVLFHLPHIMRSLTGLADED